MLIESQMMWHRDPTRIVVDPSYIFMIHGMHTCSLYNCPSSSCIADVRNDLFQFTE